MSEQTTAIERPLSPHLQVYRLPYNALMSISGRMVGIGLALSLIVLLGWFIAVVWNPEFFEQSMVFLKAPWVKYFMMLWAFAVFFYIGNGVRHVLWSMGIGVNEKAGIRSGNLVLILSALLTFLLWQISCGCWSGSNHYEAAPMTSEVESQQDWEQVNPQWPEPPEQSQLQPVDGVEIIDPVYLQDIEVIEGVE
jgi:succinate dehydrogenase / fumarate reductase cytochrome b subunit